MITAPHEISYPPEPPGWSDVDIRGLAKLLGCRTHYPVRDLVTAGAIPHYRLGRRKGVRFTWRDVCEIRALREHRAAHESAPSQLAGLDPARIAKSLTTLRKAKAARAA